MTYVYEKFDANDAVDRARKCNRLDQFGYDGWRALHEYIESLAEETGEPIEWDCIALCCDYSRYESLEELQKEYPDIKDMDDLRDNTVVIEIDNDAFIAGAF